MGDRFESFTSLITKLNRTIHKIESAEMQKFGLNGVHLYCLHYLEKEKKLTAKEIATISLEDKGAISRALSFLESGQFISCDSTAKKRYNAYFTLTEKGKKVVKHISNVIEQVLISSSIGVTEENRQIMYDSLNIINNNLNDFSNRYGK